MVRQNTVRPLHVPGACTATLVSLLGSLGLATPLQAQTESISPATPIAQAAPASTDDLPDDLRPLSQGSSLLSLEGGQRLLDNAALLMEQGRYADAQQNLRNARIAFNQISNFHQQLFDLFLGIDARVAERQRLSAVEAAQLRDEAAYRLALAHVAADEHALSVPLLIQVLRSQNPTSNLGQQSHQRLFEIGFIDTPSPLLNPGSAADLGGGSSSTNPVATGQETADGTTTAAEAPDDRPLLASDEVLSLRGGRRLMAEATAVLSARDYGTATEKLKEARRVLNQLSNLYQDLNSSFRGIYTDIAEAEQLRAVEAASLRDEATYQLALVHRVQNQSELAVPLLIQVLQSQNPASELGQQAYAQLLELGFVDTPYRWQGVTGGR
ncbi:MAG: hypothetical protein ACO4AI_11220 [Prochlorothrix sp.]